MSNRRWFLSNRYTARPMLRCSSCRLTYSGYHIPRDGKCSCGGTLEVPTAAVPVISVTKPVKAAHSRHTASTDEGPTE